MCCTGMLSSALGRSIHLLHEVIKSWENYKYEQRYQGEEQTVGTDGELEVETRWSEKDSARFTNEKTGVLTDGRTG